MKKKKIVAALFVLSGLLVTNLAFVQNYLTNVSSKFISKEEYEEIRRWCINAKKEGNITGGIVSQENNGYIKDEVGHFLGAGKRR